MNNKQECEHKEARLEYNGKWLCKECGVEFTDKQEVKVGMNVNLSEDSLNMIAKDLMPREECKESEE